MVPQPTKALILIFPLSGQIKEKHQAEDEKLKSEGGGVPVDPTVIWIKQTVCSARTLSVTEADWVSGIDQKCLRDDGAVAFADERRWSISSR